MRASGLLACLRLALLVLSCGPHVDPGALGHDPLSMPPGQAVRIDVRTQPARPKLALIEREGDPAPALVVAVAAGVGAVGHAALAGLLQERLQEGKSGARVESDGAGLRATLPLQQGTGPAMAAWLAAIKAPVKAAEAEGLAAVRVEALREAPLEPALAPIAACSAAGAALARDIKRPSAAELERLRAGALVLERTAMAVVGAHDATEAAAAALAELDGWPAGSAAPARSMPAEHAGYLDPALPRDEARVALALRGKSAVDAVGAVDRLRGGSTLSHKLFALDPPWAVESVRATALPSGGCVALDLRRAAPAGDAAASARSAASAAKLALGELLAQERIATDPFVVTREIIAPGDAVEVASRAAWWALSSPADGPPVVASAAAFGAAGREPLDAADAEVHAAYRGGLGDVAALAPRPLAARKVAVERGQGQVWTLVATPCALLHEGPFDAGVSALAAAAAIAQEKESSVELEVWASPDGLGVIAHGGPLSADDLGVAERVANAAARAYSRVPDDAVAIEAARDRVLASTGGDLGHALFSFGERAAPNHPGWLAPWGSPRRLVATTLGDAAGRWREVLRMPVRVAVLANHDASQGAAAGDAVDRWLLPEAAARPCSENASLDPPLAGHHAVAADEEGATLVAGAAYRGAAERAFAELTAAALGGPDGALAGLPQRWRVEVVGGSKSGALLFSARAADGGADEARAALEATLASLAVDAVGEMRARERLAEHKAARMRRPRERLLALWRGDAADGAIDGAGWRAWIASHLGKGRLIVISSD